MVAVDHAEQAMYALAAAMEARDPCTEAHTHRVARFARRIGRRMGLPHEAQVALYRGGVLHDIGKIGIPDEVLLKPGELDSREQAAIQRHPIIGEQIAARLDSAAELLPMIRHHHERYDGTGYPDGLAGEQIPLLARILSACDAYDALTNDRPYRKRLSTSAALTVLRGGADRQWDPRVVSSIVDEIEGGRGQRWVKASEAV